MEDNLLFQLSNELKYSKDGDFSKTATIEIEPPSYACMEYAVKISQHVSRAIMDSNKYRNLVSENEAEKADSGDVLDSNAVKFLLFSSSIDCTKTIKIFEKLMLSSAYVDTGIRFKQSYFKKIDVNDLIRFACEYIAHFTVPSLLSEMEEKAGD